VIEAPQGAAGCFLDLQLCCFALSRLIRNPLPWRGHNLMVFKALLVRVNLWSGLSMRSLLRSLLKLSFLAFLVGTAYVASPFMAAWNLREAVKAGNVEAVQGKVQWDTVRASLKTSLAKHPELFAEATMAGENVKPTMWQRIKSTFGVTMMDRFIESYVTPEGLPKLFQYRQAWRDNVSGDTAQLAATPRLERMKQFYDRIKRAEFQGFRKVEIEMQDRKNPDRRYVSTMELIDFDWKLTSLRVISVGASDRVAGFVARTGMR
jgi:hypothetical protein